ncbi:MAG: zinc ABC transporter substrate-binding protein, partial [Bdellovibrionota bacterium]
TYKISADDGIYEVYLENQTTKGNDKDIITLSVNGESLPKNSDSKSTFMHFEDVKLPKNDSVPINLTLRWYATPFEEELLKKLEQKVSEWQSRLKKSQVTKLITYHPSLNYFLERFKIASPVYIENKPGVPPSGQHILSVIQLMKDQKLKIILVDNFFDTKIADRIAKEVPGAKVRSVGVAVGSASELKTLEDLIEQLVRTIEGA